MNSLSLSISPTSPLSFLLSASRLLLGLGFLPLRYSPPQISSPNLVSPIRSLCAGNDSFRFGVERSFLLDRAREGDYEGVFGALCVLSWLNIGFDLVRLGETSEGKDEVCAARMGHLSTVVGSQAGGSPVSGGGLSQDGRFKYGYASSPGKRASMEDFYETRIDKVEDKIVGLFGVFDGHGGARAAEYVKEHLFSNLIGDPNFMRDTKSALVAAYNHTDSEFLKCENSQHRDAGSTASTAVLVGDRLVVANVGDSRAVICRGGNAIAVSRDHKPDQTDERQRIEEAGGFVMWAGTWRVGGVLAVSRAFGDRFLKQYVVATPEIQEEVIDASLEFLILASDGLWDVVSNEEAVAIVKQTEDPEQAAKKLLQEAYHRESADNITCVVVRFLHGQNSNSM